MRAMVLTGIRQAEIRNVPDPTRRNDTDVLVRVDVVGVCGSDVHYYTTGRIGSQVVRYPFCVGHEMAGTVVQTGSRVTRFRPGDRAAIDPAISCGQCDQCRAGRPHTCRHLRFLGCPGQMEGCLCDYVVMPETCLFPIGPSMTLEQAALVEPMAIGVYAARQSIPLRNAAIGILGAGPIGLSVLLAARHAGARRIYVTDRIDARLIAARRAGADGTVNPDKEDVTASLAAAEPALLDAVFECCGQQEALDQAVELLKPGGKLMLIGIPEVDRVSFVIDAMRRKEITLQNVRRQNDCTPTAIDLIAQGSVKADFMITHRFPLDQAPAAFDLVAGYRDGVIKAMIEMTPRS